MIPKLLEEISAEDIVRIVSEGWSEGLQLEFKGFHGKSLRPEKVRYPVCAFANTSGGDLILGIHAKGGIAQDIMPIPTSQVDDEKLRIEALIRDGIEPYPSTVRVQEVPVTDGAVIVVRVERSYLAPHRTVRDRMFKARNSGGNYDMTMDQIRRAYVEGSTLVERIREFRTQRVRLLTEGPLPVESLARGPKVMLHIIPLAAFTGESGIDIHAAHDQLFQGITAFGYTIDSRQYNLDGVLGIAGNDANPSGYVQIFRSGAIEAVSELYNQPASPDQERTASVAPADNIIVPYFKPLVRAAINLGLTPPVYSFLSVTGVAGHILMVDSTRIGLRHRMRRIDRDVLMLPDSEMPLDEDGAVRSLRQTFDVYWQAFGFRDSPNFDENGNWTKGFRT